MLIKLGPAWFRRRMVDLTPIPAVQRLKSVIDTMEDTTEAIYQDHLRDMAEADGSAGVGRAPPKKSGRGLDILTSLSRSLLHS
jgi:hypothetical protein